MAKNKDIEMKWYASVLKDTLNTISKRDETLFKEMEERISKKQVTEEKKLKNKLDGKPVEEKNKMLEEAAVSLNEGALYVRTVSASLRDALLKHPEDETLNSLLSDLTLSMEREKSELTTFRKSLSPKWLPTVKNEDTSSDVVNGPIITNPTAGKWTAPKPTVSSSGTLETLQDYAMEWHRDERAEPNYVPTSTKELNDIVQDFKESLAVGEIPANSKFVPPDELVKELGITVEKLTILNKAYDDKMEKMEAEFAKNPIPKTVKTPPKKYTPASAHKEMMAALNKIERNTYATAKGGVGQGAIKGNKTKEEKEEKTSTSSKVLTALKFTPLGLYVTALAKIATTSVKLGFGASKLVYAGVKKIAPPLWNVVKSVNARVGKFLAPDENGRRPITSMAHKLKNMYGNLMKPEFDDQTGNKISPLKKISYGVGKMAGSTFGKLKNMFAPKETESEEGEEGEEGDKRTRGEGLGSSNTVLGILKKIEENTRGAGTGKAGKQSKMAEWFKNSPLGKFTNHTVNAGKLVGKGIDKLTGGRLSNGVGSIKDKLSNGVSKLMPKSIGSSVPSVPGLPVNSIVGEAGAGAALPVLASAAALLLAGGTAVNGMMDISDGKKVESVGDIVPEGGSFLNPFQWAMNGGMYLGNKVNEWGSNKDGNGLLDNLTNTIGDALTGGNVSGNVPNPNSLVVSKVTPLTKEEMKRIEDDNNENVNGAVIVPKEDESNLFLKRKRLEKAAEEEDAIKDKEDEKKMSNIINAQKSTTVINNNTTKKDDSSHTSPINTNTESSFRRYIDNRTAFA